MKERQHLKLNVGCGFDYRQGYVNVDLHARHNPDVVSDVLDLASFPSSFYEELVAQDVLEHVSRTDVRKALFEWNRVLKLGGGSSFEPPSSGAWCGSSKHPKTAASAIRSG